MNSLKAADYFVGQVGAIASNISHNKKIELIDDIIFQLQIMRAAVKFDTKEIAENNAHREASQ